MGGLLPRSMGAWLVPLEDVSPAAPTAGVVEAPCPKGMDWARGPLLVGDRPGVPASPGQVGALELAEVLLPEFPQAVAPPSHSHVACATHP